MAKSKEVVPVAQVGNVIDGQEISSSLEDYLETILMLTRRREVARAKEIGDQLQVNRSSVTSALQNLAKRGLINYSPYEYVTLTPAGLRAAEDVARRHVTLRDFFSDVLQIEEEEANAAACRMEHALPPVVMERLAAFIEFVRRCPAGIGQWDPSIGFRCSRTKTPGGPECEPCSRPRKPDCC